jgi:hypothetical protein
VDAEDLHTFPYAFAKNMKNPPPHFRGTATFGGVPGAMVVLFNGGKGFPRLRRVPNIARA